MCLMIVIMKQTWGQRKLYAIDLDILLVALPLLNPTCLIYVSIAR
jgi:hypothetical protein